MKFSILQCVYKNDNPQFLSDAFSSILANSIQPEIIILVKDGELTSELEDVINTWSKKLTIKIVGYQNNMGLAHALNYGLQFVETELVARMDSDDVCFSDRFQKELEFFSANEHCEILGSGISEFYIDNLNNEYKRNRFYPSVITKESKALFKGTPLAHPTLMIKTSLLKEYGYSEETRMCEDIDLWFRLIKGNHIIYNLQEPLLSFRITDGTFKRRSISKAFSEFGIYWKNLYSIFGINLRLIYPIVRLFVRFLPYSLSKKMYFSKSRNIFFNKKN